MPKTVRLYSGLLLSLVLLWGACARPGSQKQVRLAVVVVVDQMRADHLPRFAGLYSGGLARLLREGHRFTDAHHDHAITVTAAGHATIATGAFPAHHGIISNEWFDRTEGREVYCSDDSAARVLGYPRSAGRSPARLLLPALGDWLKAASPQSRVFAVSRKDRPAIMMGGKKPDGVYWYNSSDGHFVTSEYYTSSYPAWVDSFNARKLADRYLSEGWQKLMPEEAYFVSREDRFPHEGDGMHTTFPHQFPSEAGKPNRDYYSALSTSPFSDELVFEFSRALVRHEALGQDAAPDVLFIGASAADAIGHAYGPLSQESEDHFLRLDRYLGDFMAFLDETVGRDRYVLVLSSDHGVLPLPEELERRGFDARRFTVQDLMREVGPAIARVNQQFGIKGNLIQAFSNGVVLNQKVIEAAGARREEVERALAEALRQHPFVEDVYTYSEMMQTDGAENRPYFEAFRRSFHPERSADLMIRFKPYYLLSSWAQGTSHGSPYDYDTHVPIIFWGSGIEAGETSARVRTVDIAPTLAAMLKIPAPQEVDGKPLF